MPTIKEDITLSQTSYTDHPDDLDINSSDPKEVKLAQRWEDMKKDGWEYLGNQDMMKPPPTNGFRIEGVRVIDFCSISGRLSRGSLAMKIMCITPLAKYQ